MTARELLRIVSDGINMIDAQKVEDIKKSILTNGWQGAPILMHERLGLLITGSHRLAALKSIDEDIVWDDLEFDLDALDGVAEAVDDIVDEWMEETGDTMEFFPYDALALVFEGTHIERYKNELPEW